MDQIEILMHASLPPSPAPSHQDDPDEKGAPVRDPRPRSASEGPGIRGRRLFATSGPSDLATSTPTKVLDVARDCWSFFCWSWNPNLRFVQKKSFRRNSFRNQTHFKNINWTVRIMFYNRHQYVLFNPKKKCGCIEVKSKVWTSRTSGFEPRTFHGNSVDVLPLSYPHLHVFWSSNQSLCDNLLFRFERKDETWVSSIFEAGSSSWIVLSLCFFALPKFLRLK